MKKNRVILIAIMLLIIIIIPIILYVVKPFSSSDNSETSNAIEEKESKPKTEAEIAKEEIASLKEMTEKERIVKYFSKYLTFIESGDYQKAYGLLYEDFKANYFPDIEKYKEYVDKLYPGTPIVQYADMQRQGGYFILYLNIVDGMGDKKPISQKFIIYENGYNNFTLSFEVI